MSRMKVININKHFKDKEASKNHSKNTTQMIQSAIVLDLINLYVKVIILY